MSLPSKPADPVTILNATARDTCLVPAVGPVEFDGHTAIGIRTGNYCIALPGEVAIDIALEIAECTVEQTGQADRNWIERLIVRVDALRASLVALNSGNTYEAHAPAGETLQ